MDLTSLIEIVVAIGVIYFLIKFILSPVIRIILGIIIFLVVIYLLQKFLGFNFDKILAPFGVSLNLNKWGLNLNWIISPVNYYINQIKNFLTFIWGNVPKGTKP